MQLALDTETTGLEVAAGHRLIELAIVEISDRRLTGFERRWRFNPERQMDPGAIEVHGISNEELLDQPRFAEVAEDIIKSLSGHELIIHNADFDVGFLNAELARLKGPKRRIGDHATILDSLKLARELHPGQRNTLDALCKRYEVDLRDRQVHGALIDARLLAQVYLAMTQGQASFELIVQQSQEQQRQRRALDLSRLRSVRVEAEEQQLHEAALDALEKASKRASIWREWQRSIAEASAQARATA
jgi:DNA polymerase-3 subunit epsilon